MNLKKKENKIPIPDQRKELDKTFNYESFKKENELKRKDDELLIGVLQSQENNSFPFFDSQEFILSTSSQEFLPFFDSQFLPQNNSQLISQNNSQIISRNNSQILSQNNSQLSQNSISSLSQGAIRSTNDENDQEFEVDRIVAYKPGEIDSSGSITEGLWKVVWLPIKEIREYPDDTWERTSNLTNCIYEIFCYLHNLYLRNNMDLYQQIINELSYLKIVDENDLFYLKIMNQELTKEESEIFSDLCVEMLETFPKDRSEYKKNLIKEWREYHNEVPVIRPKVINPRVSFQKFEERYK